VPNTSEWKKYTIDLTPYKSYTNLRVRFELQSLRGNNIYIDEFKVDEPTSLGEQLKSEMNFTLFPNPSRGISKLSFTNSKNQLFEIGIIDIQGKKIKEIFSGELSEGVKEMDIDLKDLYSGFYLVSVKTENGMFVHKIWLE
jgi:hypothetical protein